ncbi:uncharacterized protein LY89DRAFT_674942 [Mollisia scopiformis]|uniref:DUF6536 domain-containing protein n=1 Tax=Mollisia scopiformis TaxID=149040 RepID=A0A194WS84_MOLSC|nr:uncharacterized protein LY89DRAFT_674942 [Mollisia scopiformis]KUJ10828.1 hypothetical protein LY89DRAFT_674942 [Mollisia scopiformis]
MVYSTSRQSTAEDHELQPFYGRDNSSQPDAAQSLSSNEDHHTPMLGHPKQLDDRSPKMESENPEHKPYLKRVYDKLVRGHKYAEIGPLQPDLHQRAWRTGVKSATLGATVIFILNAGITLFIATRCSKISFLDSGLHVGINILSTAFLSAINFVMQILNAPSRSQLDDRHQLGMSLDIGIPSFKNVLRVGWLQGFLWFFIGSFGYHTTSLAAYT